MSDFDAAKLQQMGTEAAAIGSDFKAKADTFESAAKSRKEASATARDSVVKDDRSRGGFDTFMFQGLSRVAGAFGRLYNDPTSPEASAAAELAARSFTASFTGATDKTAKGGTAAGYVHHILLGANGESVRNALQRRLDYWQESVDSETDPKRKAEAAKLAARYTVVCGDAPLPDGSFPVDSKGVAKVPRHNGRPAATVNGVDIAAGRATDRKAQFAAMSRLYAMHGAAALSPEVVDAFLDNGGRFQAEVNVTALASQAQETLEKLLLAGGNISGDGSFLTVAVARLAAIAKNGLTPARVAPTIPAPAPAATPGEVTGEGEGDKSGDEVSEGVAGKPRGRRAASGGL